MYGISLDYLSQEKGHVFLEQNKIELAVDRIVKGSSEMITSYYPALLSHPKW